MSKCDQTVIAAYISEHQFQKKKCRKKKNADGIK